MESHNAYFPPLEFPTLVHILRWRAQEQGKKQAYTFLQPGTKSEVSWTYEELDRKARAIAATLLQISQPGERALLIYTPDIDFISAYYGCLYAGVIAIPAYPPHPNRSLAKWEAIVKNSEVRLVLSSSRDTPTVQQCFAASPLLSDLLWLQTDIIDDRMIEGDYLFSPTSESIAFLQYTSGSTSLPKGVMVSHGNIIHNQRLIHEAVREDGRPIVSWLPHAHDMGLIGVIMKAAYVGIHCILFSPFHFLQRPFTWLKAISDYQAHTSGAPNFAYDLCIQKITPEQRKTLDLQHWKLAFSGAEPVRAQTIQRFIETFQDVGFRPEAFFPCYGLAEATLFVTGNSKEKPPTIRVFDKKQLEQNKIQVIDDPDQRTAQDPALVGCGYPRLDLEIAIVHPETGLRCQNEVGEIWIKGASVAQGYWNQPYETEKAFNAFIAETGEGPFYRTGDLGFIEDGELYVTGRLKDLIILNGRNHYPQDIEETVGSSHKALKFGEGIAFSVDIDGKEQLVVTNEIDRTQRNVNSKEIIDVVRQAVMNEHEVQVYEVLLLRPGYVPKTANGKLQRSACRAQYLAGTLKVWSRG